MSAQDATASVTNGLVFHSIDEPRRELIYRGPFGSIYHIESSCDAFKFVHGDRIRFRKGKQTGTTGVVLGVHHDLLWIHDESQGVAVAIRDCHSYADLHERHDPETISPVAAGIKGPKEVLGPLSLRYTVCADPSTIESRYGVSPGQRVYLNAFKAECTVVGEFLNVLWVSKPGARVASPLPGATNEETMMKLYGLVDYDASTGSVSPRTPRTPGRAGGARGGDKPYTDGDESVLCQVPFGNTVSASKKPTDMQVFGVSHGQRLCATAGQLRGSTFTVLGVQAGSLYVHVDGERKCTCLRNCKDAQDLMEIHGCGPAKPSAATAAKHAAAAASPPKRPATTAAAANNNNKSVTIKESPAKPLLVQCWTAHGRQGFDAAAEALAPFKLSHGDLVEAQSGGDVGKRFLVLGVAQGTLWVIPHGKQRASALRHCADHVALRDQYNFKVVSRRNSLSEFTDRADEPPPTPLASPRGASQSPRKLQLSPRGPAQAADSTSREVAFSSSPNNNAASSKVPAFVPPIRISGVLGAGSSSSGNNNNEPEDSPRQPQPGHSPPQREPVNRAVEPGGKFKAGQMPATRNYLKAYALLMCRCGREEDNLDAFRDYYVGGAQVRLQAALDALPKFVGHWESTEWKLRRVAFGHATTNEMLDAMRKVPHIFSA